MADSDDTKKNRAPAPTLAELAALVEALTSRVTALEWAEEQRRTAPRNS